MLKEQQESQGLRIAVKRVEKEKEVIRLGLEGEIKELRVVVEEERERII